MNETRFITVSQFVPSGQRAHRESPFGKLNWGFNSIQPSENVLSSSWLWQALGQEDVRPRYAMGFPDEWLAFRSSPGSDRLLSTCVLDLWVFQTLELEQRIFLASVLQDNPEYRLVVAVNHLSEWKCLVECSHLKGFFAQRRAYLSFLKSNHDLDPFLKPQEVLWQLKEIPIEIPILIQDIPQSQPSFFQTLKKEDIAQEMKTRHPWTLWIFKFLDKAGLGNFILFIEAFLGFLISYRLMRLAQAVGYFFQIDPWVHKLRETWVVVWHRTTLKFLSYAWYRVTWKALNIFWFQGIQGPVIFLWYRFIYKPMDWTWNILLRKNGLQVWHKVVWPSISFSWHRVVWPSISFSWHKVVWPTVSFSWHKVAWPVLRFAWHKLFWPTMDFFWFQICVQTWHKLIWPVCNFTWYKVIYHPIDFATHVWLRKISIFCWHQVLWPVASLTWYQGVFPAYNFLKYEVVLRAIRIIRYQVLLKLWVFFRYRIVEVLLILAYPFRKAYWFASFQYDKRIRYRKRYHES